MINSEWLLEQYEKAVANFPAQVFETESGIINIKATITKNGVTTALKLDENFFA